MRPNFFVNTPDILHESLQYGGPPMFEIRAVLAAMLSPHVGRVLRVRAVRARRRASRAARSTSTREKYQLRPRDWAAAERPAAASRPTCGGSTRSGARTRRCSSCATLHFHPVDNPNLLVLLEDRPAARPTPSSWSSTSSATTPRRTTVSLDMPRLGLDWHERFSVHRRAHRRLLRLGQDQLRRLDPFREPAHVFAVTFLRPVQFPPPVPDPEHVHRPPATPRGSPAR